MKPSISRPSEIDEYIGKFPKETRDMLEQIRSAVKKAAPGAEEVISYKMPAFKLNGILVWFAAFKDHIGFFPTADSIKEFQKELIKYETSKGTIRFPLDKKIPLSLISRIIKFRVKENLNKKKK